MTLNDVILHVVYVSLISWRFRLKIGRYAAAEIPPTIFLASAAFYFYGL